MSQYPPPPALSSQRPDPQQPPVYGGEKSFKTTGTAHLTHQIRDRLPGGAPCSFCRLGFRKVAAAAVDKIRP